jgi:hypothetical protein
MQQLVCTSLPLSLLVVYIDSIDVETQYRSYLIWRLLDDKCANFDFVTLY